ncbi:MAG TPA: Holliday junction branch migration protein RuvA [Polyangiaceae bacterium]|nr:Holliday junction branch migration protein RuvA [Polyangiaceae bacterium]HMR75355.1 Holliday junction branch migration protein RuvA [Polyangiaceae bacterium]
MIGRITGKVVAEEATGLLLVDVHGVGFEVLTPVGSRARAASTGELVTLQVHTHVREDAFELFGFATETERRLFRLLIGVPNVGPKLALGTLSALPVEELRTAVAQGDVARLTRVPGIGKKTAERLVLELKDKLEREVAVGSAPQPKSGDAERLLSALTNMGYRAQEAQRAVSALGDRVGSTPMVDLLREALAHLTP